MSGVLGRTRATAGALWRRLRALQRDRAHNRRFATAARRFLIVRHPMNRVGFYDVVIDWVAERLPELLGHFELRLLPCRISDWSPYVLHVPWLQDPVEHWSEVAFRQANQVAAECDARGVPIINRVDRLTNAAKSTGSELIARAGIRTPRIIPIRDADELRETRYGLELPLLVREDWGHQGPIVRVETERELADLDLARLSRPVAVELIDVRSADGLYRKYRYLAAGDDGAPLHLHAQRDWLVRGSGCAHDEAEERAFLDRPDPNAARLQEARRHLDLDFVAFDYSYDRAGELVVWEANPFPYLHFARRRRRYRTPTLERALALIVTLYLSRAGLTIPGALRRLAGTDDPR